MRASWLGGLLVLLFMLVASNAAADPDGCQEGEPGPTVHVHKRSELAATLGVGLAFSGVVATPVGALVTFVGGFSGHGAGPSQTWANPGTEHFGEGLMVGGLVGIAVGVVVLLVANQQTTDQTPAPNRDPPAHDLGAVRRTEVSPPQATFVPLFTRSF